MSIVTNKRVLNTLPSSLNVGEIYYVKKNGRVTIWIIQNDKSPIQVNHQNSWIELKASSVTSPVLVGSTLDGEVYQLNNGVFDYYDQRSDDVKKQAIYLNWDGTDLSDLIAKRILDI